jgi:hypothetical protein
LTGARNVCVEGAAKRIENVRWRVPLVSRSDALFVKGHDVNQSTTKLPSRFCIAFLAFS